MNDQSYIKGYLSGLVDKAHQYITTQEEYKIKNMLCYENQSIMNCKTYHQALFTKKIDRLFFVWLGSINDRVIEYINIWRTSNDGTFTLNIYYDSNFFLYSELKNTLKVLYDIDQGDPKSIIYAQNDFFKKIKLIMRKGYSFDTALIMLTARANPSTALALSNLKKHSQDYFARKTAGINAIDIASNKELFINGFYREIYNLELTLRGNAAAATDIIRLLILYAHGGMYIDVDTLPSLTSIFGDMPQNVNSNIVNVVRSEYYLRALRKKNDCLHKNNTDISSFESYLYNHHPSVLECIKKNIDSAIDLSLKIVNPVVYTDSLMIASFDNMFEFNNNILASCKSSRMVKIVLRELKRRYRHIFNMNYHLGKVRT
ncbi:TcdA/TcdB catalytic glycosyltransferase domain-containing protein, partial [Aeromonas jandaei]